MRVGFGLWISDHWAKDSGYASLSIPGLGFRVRGSLTWERRDMDGL